MLSLTEAKKQDAHQHWRNILLKCFHLTNQIGAYTDEILPGRELGNIFVMK